MDPASIPRPLGPVNDDMIDGLPSGHRRYAAHKRGATSGCYSCGEAMPRGECPKSQRPCGHHCNHSWTHDHCDWCDQEFGEGPDGD